MSLVSERWAVVAKGADPDFGLPMVLVAREKQDFTTRVTTWKLVQHPNGWYNAGQMLSCGRFQIDPHRKKGLKLSTNRIDNILRNLATTGESELLHV